MKKKYTIYANCQGHALAKALNSSQAFKNQYDYIVTKPIQGLNINDLNRLIEEVIPVVDLFIYQPISEKYKNNFKYSAKYMLDHLKLNCKRISFPSCYFKGYHPELRVLKDEKNINIPMEFKVNEDPLKSIFVHDANIIKSFLESKSVDEMKKNFLDDDFYEKPFLDKIIKATLTELESRENKGNIDIKISSFIENNYRIKKLFHTFNHPTNTLFEYIAICVLELLSIKPDFKNVPDAIGVNSFPIYRSVYDNLGLTFDNLSEHKVQGQLIDTEDVIKQYFEFYKTLPEIVLRKNIEDWKIG